MDIIGYLNDLFCKDGDEMVIYSMASIEKLKEHVLQYQVKPSSTVWFAVLSQWVVSDYVKGEQPASFDLTDYFNSVADLTRVNIPQGVYLLVPAGSDMENIKAHHAIFELPSCPDMFITVIDGVFCEFETLKKAVEAVDASTQSETNEPLEFISASKKRCSFCYEPSKKKCPCGCRYCSDSCQKLDWKTHKNQCTRHKL